MKKCILVLVSILLFGKLSAPCLWRKENNKILYYFQTEQINKYLSTQPFTRQHLMLALEMNVKSPEIVYRQAILETGWFGSKSFVKYNNLFGMRQPKIRKTTAKGRALGTYGFTMNTVSIFSNMVGAILWELTDSLRFVWLLSGTGMLLTTLILIPILKSLDFKSQKAD